MEMKLQLLSKLNPEEDFWFCELSGGASLTPGFESSRFQNLNLTEMKLAFNLNPEDFLVLVSLHHTTLRRGEVLPLRALEPPRGVGSSGGP